MPITSERVWFLIWSVILAAFAGSLLIGTSYYFVQKTNEVEQASRNISLKLSLRKQATERYYRDLVADVDFLATSDDIHNALTALNGAWYLLDADMRDQLRVKFSTDEATDTGSGGDAMWDLDEGTLYEASRVEFHEDIKPFVEQGGYKDLLIINKSGDVVYSATGSPAQLKNLSDSVYASTPLHTTIESISAGYDDGVAVIVDFVMRHGGRPESISFAIAKILDTSGSVIGTIVLQVRQDVIESVTRFDTGGGDLVETHLIGEDYLYRNRAHDEDGQLSALGSRFEGIVDRAAAGRSGVQRARDTNGRELISAFTSIIASGTTWVLIAELPVSSVTDHINVLKITLLAGLAGSFVAILFGIAIVRNALFANRRITRGDMRRIQESWARIRRPDQFAQVFFDELLAHDPSLRPLFKANMEKQSERFAQMLGHLIKNLDKFESQRMVIQRLGRDHSEYGVRISNFEIFGVVLMNALKQHTELNLSQREQDSWADFYFVLCQEMAKGMAK